VFYPGNEGRQFPFLRNGPKSGENKREQAHAREGVSEGQPGIMVPIERRVNILVSFLEAHHDEVEQHKEKKLQLDEHQHWPVDRNHIERELDEHEDCRQSWEQVPDQNITTADKEEELAAGGLRHPVAEGEHDAQNEAACVQRDQPLPEKPWLLKTSLFFTSVLIVEGVHTVLLGAIRDE